jgi:YVTN family beta-propeller protein
MKKKLLTFIIYLSIYTTLPIHLFAYTAYFSNVADGTVTVTNTEDNSIITTITGITSARDLAITPDGRNLYVSQLNDTISVIDTSTNQVIDTISTNDPRQIAISPDGDFLYVTNVNSTTVKIISTSTNEVVSSIEIGRATLLIAINPSGDLACIGASNGSIYVVNLVDQSIISTISGFSGLTKIIFSIDGTKIYIADTHASSDRIIVYDASTFLQLHTIPVGSNPSSITNTPDGELLYVTNQGDNSVSVISTELNTVISSIAIGSDPKSIAITPDGSTLYTANNGSDNASMIIAATNIATDVLSLSNGLYNVLIAPLATPISLSGSQKINDFGFIYELYNYLFWTPSITPATIGYNIYRDEVLISSISGINTATYLDHNREEGVSYQYSIRSRAGNGELSYPTTITIHSR